MLDEAPSRMPKYMPMTSAVAPKFSAAHPRAAVVFDNLHMMHDIISDILTADTIPPNRKGRMIDQQLDKLQDPSRDVISMEEWRMMAEHMGGVDMMGGRATGLRRAVQAPSPMTADSGHMAHDKEPTGRTPNGIVPDTTPDAGAKPRARERPREPAPRDSVPHQH
jgi:hypothetical protein